MYTKTLAAVALVVASVVGFSNTQAESKGSSSPAMKWDCVSNETGKPLWVTLATDTRTIRRYVGVGKTLRFRVDKKKTVASAAFASGKDDLIALFEFESLPQAFPPKNCYPILPKTSVTPAKRVSIGPEQVSEEAAPIL